VRHMRLATKADAAVAAAPALDVDLRAVIEHPCEVKADP
jgi:hypothetical protein